MSGETKKRIGDLEAEIVRLKEARPSLRDQFAMAAINSIIVSCGWDKAPPKDFAVRAYYLADAMMEARIPF